MKNIIRYVGAVLGIALLATSCQKMERPALGNFPQDANPPGGPLKFYVAFDGTTNDPLMNAVDSSRANFPAENPFTSIDGVSGKAAQGVSQTAIKYGSANDFSSATSFTISFWERNTVPGGGNPQWLFGLASRDYWHQSALFLFVDHDGAGSTASEAVVKMAIQDQWFEFTPGNGRMPGNLLDGNWHHMAIVYDENTSKLTYYVDGQALTGLNPVLTDVKDGGAPRGPLSFNNTYNFILGGWNKHGNLGQGAPTDAWIESWQGGLDQFRMYSEALSAADIQELYTARK
jgi:hypothetical protein